MQKNQARSWIVFNLTMRDSSLIVCTMPDGTFDGVILIPVHLTHYSYALRDAIQSIDTFHVLEVHISNIYSRESFRQISVTAPACIGQITGLGIQGYYSGY
jgi:3-dehydroquinate dehydratase-2